MSDWKEKELGAICTIQLGKTPARANNRLWDTEKVSNNVWLSIADLKHGKEVSDSKEFISDTAAESMKIVPKGTLMISFKLSLGRTSFAGKDLYTNEAIASLINLSEELDKNYLNYYLTHFDWDKASESDIKVKGKTLNKAKLSKLPILYPSLSKQKLIASKLDHAFEAIDQAIANTEKNIENVEDLEKSYLNSMFNLTETVTNCKLGEIIEFVNGFAFKSSEKVESSDTQLIRMTNLYMNEFNLNRNPVFYPNHFTETYKKFVLTNGDLIMSLTGTAGKEDFGYAVQVEKQSNNLLLNQRITKILVKDSNQLNKSYLLHFLRSRVFLDKLYSLATGTRQANISTNKISQIHIPLPTILRQGEISAEVDYLASESLKLKNDLREKLSLLNELKMSILEKAFKGELV